MFEQLKDKISDVKTIGSLELQIESDGTLVGHWIVLSKNKQVVEIVKSGIINGDFALLPTLIPTSVPLVLSASGKGVLHKKVQQQVDNKQNLFDYVFPNARIADYAVQYQPCADHSVYVSVIRKDQVERFIKQFSELGYDVLSMSLGGFAVLPLLKAIQFSDDKLNAGRHQLQMNNAAILNYGYGAQEQVSTIDIAGQKINSPLLIAYGMAFQYLVKGLDKAEVEFDEFHHQQIGYREKRVFKVLSIGSLVFFFGLLIINTVAYSLLAEKNNRLSGEYGSIQHLSVSNKKGAEEFNRKETFLSQAGWLNPAATSYYSDRIASSLPDEIQLTVLSVYPFNEQMSRKNKKEVFETNMILVEGVSKKPTDINHWVKELNDYSWIKQIKVQDYSFDYKTGRGNFSLHILISGELE